MITTRLIASYDVRINKTKRKRQMLVSPSIQYQKVQSI